MKNFLFVINKNIQFYWLKLKKFKFIYMLLLIIPLMLMSTMHAINNFFYRTKEQSISFLQKDDLPSLEVDHKEFYGNYYSHSLIPLILPNLNDTIYSHTISFVHEVRWNMKKMLLNKPLFLKIKTFFDSKNTIHNPNDYFINDISIMQPTEENYTIYRDDQKPQLLFDANNEGFMTVKFDVQEPKIFVSDYCQPELFLVVEYELVDANGCSFEGGKKIVISNDINNRNENKNIIKNT